MYSDGQQGNIPPASDQAPQAHERYYLPDGNIIVIVGDTKFRLYRGLLAQQSSVFSDMLQMSRPSQDDLMEDLPVVTLSGDSPIDFCHVLDIISRAAKNDLGLEDVLGVMEIAHKYSFDEVFEWAKHRFQKCVPTTFERLLKLTGKDEGWEGSHVLPMPLAARIITIMRRANLPLSFSTIATYTLAINSSSFERGEDVRSYIRFMETIDVEDRVRLLFGVNDLGYEAFDIMSRMKEFAMNRPCPICRRIGTFDLWGGPTSDEDPVPFNNAHLRLWTLHRDPLFELLDIHHAKELSLWTPLVKLCNTCETERRKEAKGFAERLFNKIGEIFFMDGRSTDP